MKDLARLEQYGTLNRQQHLVGSIDEITSLIDGRFPVWMFLDEEEDPPSSFHSVSLFYFLKGRPGKIENGGLTISAWKHPNYLVRISKKPYWTFHRATGDGIERMFLRVVLDMFDHVDGLFYAVNSHPSVFDSNEDELEILREELLLFI